MAQTTDIGHGSMRLLVIIKMFLKKRRQALFYVLFKLYCNDELSINLLLGEIPVPDELYLNVWWRLRFTTLNRHKSFLPLSGS